MSEKENTEAVTWVNRKLGFSCIKILETRR